MRPGWTVLEILVVICIVTAAVCISAPAISGVRAHAKLSMTLARLGQNTAILHAYASDWNDCPPAPVAPGSPPYVIRSSAMSEDAVFDEYFRSAELWWLAMTDGYYNGTLFDRSWYPAEAERFGQPGNTAFNYPCAFVAHPAYWDPSTRTSGPSQWGAVRFSAVQYPAKKVLLSSGYQLYMRNKLCFPDGANTKVAMCDPQAAIVPAACVDGSASSPWYRDLLAGYANGDGSYHLMEWPPAGHTLGGIRGRDLR